MELRQLHSKPVFLILLTLCTLQVADAQHDPAVHIAQVLSSPAPDSAKIRILFEEGREEWFRRNLSHANSYLRASVELAERSNFDSLLADALNLLGNLHLKLQHYDSAFFYLQRATDTGNEDYFPLVYDTYSKIYLQLGDYPTALDYAFKAVAGLESNAEPRFNMMTVFAYVLVGDVLSKMGQTDRALEYYRKAYIKGLTSPVNWYIKDPILRIANEYVRRNELAKAKHLYDTIVQIDAGAVNYEPTMHAFRGLAEVAMKEGRYRDAISFYKRAFDYARDKDLSTNVEYFQTHLGAAFLADGKMDSARYYLQQAIGKSRQSRNFNNLSQAYLHLSEWQQKMGEYRQAFHTFQLHKNYQDSILNAENARAVYNLETLYQTRQKEGEISRLRESEEEKDRAIQTRNTYIFFAVAIVIVLGVILALARKNHRNKQRLHEQQVREMQQQQQVASLQAMINGQEAERTRIARDLHDDLGGLFSTMKMYMSTLEHEQPDLRHHELFQKSYALVDNTAEQVRHIAHNMMPEVLMKLGLVNALQDLCMNINAGKLVNVLLEVHGMEQRLGASTEVMLFRIIQELINNIIRHAHATEAIIQFVREGNRLSVLVEDNGRGFDTREKGDEKRAGLETIESRVAYLNGKINIDSQRDVGTTVMMDFLLNES